MHEQPLRRIENEAPPIDWSDLDEHVAMTTPVLPPRPNYAPYVAPAPTEQPHLDPFASRGRHGLRYDPAAEQAMPELAPAAQLRAPLAAELVEPPADAALPPSHGNREVIDHASALERLLAAGSHTITAGTSIPPQSEVITPYGVEQPYAGFRDFGPGATRDISWRGRINRETDDRLENPNLPQVSSETISFLPVTEPEYSEVVRTRRKHLRKEEYTSRELTGRRLPVTITNPETGDQEQAVTVAYDIGANRHAGNGAILEYRDSSRRMGNFLDTAVRVPQSVAQAFEAAVRAQPSLAREFARAAFAQSVTPETMENFWQRGDAPIRPPYESLPVQPYRDKEGNFVGAWELSIVTPGPVQQITHNKTTDLRIENVPVH